MHEGKHSSSRLHQPLLQLPGLAEKQGRNWIGYNIQIHFTTRNCKASLCNRRVDSEKGIFTGYKVVWAGKSLWRPPSPTPRQGRVTQSRLHRTGPGGFGMTSLRGLPQPYLGWGRLCSRRRRRRAPALRAA